MWPVNLYNYDMFLYFEQINEQRFKAELEQNGVGLSGKFVKLHKESLIFDFWYSWDYEGGCDWLAICGIRKIQNFAGVIHSKHSFMKI